MKEELFSFLDSRKLEQDPYIKIRIEEVEEYFRELFLKYLTNDIEEFYKLSDKTILESVLIANNPLKMREILVFLKKYPKLYKRTFGDPFIGIIHYINNLEIKKIIDKIGTGSLNDCIEAMKELKYTCIGLGIAASDFVAFFLFLKSAPKTLKEITSLFHGLTFKTYSIASSLFQAKKSLTCTETKMQNLINQYETFLNSQLNELSKECNKKEKNRNRLNRNIDQLKALLDTEEEIKNIDGVLKLCADKEMQEKVVDYIIAHNKEIYVELTKEYEHSKQNSDENLQVLFARYGFNYDLLNGDDQTKVKEMGYGEIEDLLSRLEKLSITGINIGKVSVYKLDIVEEYFTKGVFNQAWLVANHDLLYKENDELNSAIANLDELSKEGINILQYQSSLDVMRSPHLISNLNILKNYGLKITKRTNNINFLATSDLIKKIEFLISIGLYQDLKDSLDNLNYNLYDCYKLKIASALNIPFENIINNKEELIYDFANGIVPERIKELLESDFDLKVPLPAFLQEYQIDQQTLNLNGVLVSIEKVKRNIGKIGSSDAESIFYAIIYESYYTLEEIEIVRQILAPERSMPSLVRS